MPRFYFHLYNDMTALDDEGQELPDAPAAVERAMDYARDMVCESIHKGHLNLEHRIEVTNEIGELVRRVTFRDAFSLEG